MIFGDSSFFVALSDRKDRWHKDALRICRDAPTGLTVTDLVVAETVTIVGSRGGGRPAQTMYRYFRDSCSLEFVDGRRLDAAMVHHLKYDGKLSVADCASLVVMGEKGLSEILSFDSDFDRVHGITRIH